MLLVCALHGQAPSTIDCICIHLKTFLCNSLVCTNLAAPATTRLITANYNRQIFDGMTSDTSRSALSADNDVDSSSYLALIALG